MTKAERLEYIRERATGKIPLSQSAAYILEQVRGEDEDLGGITPIGEILPPDEIETSHKVTTEDEENDFSQELSPSMRRLARESDRDNAGNDNER